MKSTRADPTAQLDQASHMPAQQKPIPSRVVHALKTHRSTLPWLVLRKLLARFVRIETLIFYRQDLRRFPPPSHTTDPAVLVIPIEESLEIFGEMCARYPSVNLQQRLQREGRQGYVATHNGEIAGYAWVADSSLYIEEIACSYSVAADEIFIYDCFVDSEFRGKGIYPRMLAAILEQGGNRNSKPKSALIAASSVNRASIRGILKAGFVELKRIRYVEYGGKQWWWGLKTP